MSIPAEAMQNTPEGAVAFVKFYFDQVNKAYMTPDATLLPPLAEPECKSCNGFQANAEEYVSLKRRYASSPGELSDLWVNAGAVPEGQQMVEFTLHQLAATVVDANGVVVSTKPEGTAALKAIVAWKGDQWRAVEIG